MAVETVFGRVEQYAPAELVNTGVGLGIGALGHMGLESVFDNFFEPRYPDTYPLYSTGAAAAILVPIGLGLYFYGRKPGLEWLQYIAGGIFLAELVQILDMVRVSFSLRV